MRDLRRLAIQVGLFSLMLLLFRPVPAWASHDGPITVVDASLPLEEDLDGDHHFRTLKAALLGPPAPEAYGTILVEPGRYEGPLEIEVEGLTLRSTGGAAKTIIAGRLMIKARDVRLEGFSIEAGPIDPAVTIASSGVTLQGNRISGSLIGVLVEGASETSLEKNQIYNNIQEGLLAREAWNLKMRDNEVRGNGGSGVWIERSRDLLLERNSIAFNQLGGLWLKGSQRARLMLNTIRDNVLVGLALDGTSEAQVEGNKLISNEVGILLLKASENSIKANEILQQRAVGLVLKNGSQGNSIEQNIIRGSQGRGAIGIRLAGSTFSNHLLGNRLLENGVGLVLSQNETGSPGNNLFERNEIALSDRQGISLEAGSEGNRFLANEIHKNLQEGIVSAGEANVYENNEIYGNGLAGFTLRGSRDERLEGNHIYENGAEGIRLEGASGVLLKDNEMFRNVRDGLWGEGGRHLRLFQNSISENGASGLRTQEMESLALSHNRLLSNRDYGAYFLEVQDLLLEENEIEANGAGGVRLEGVQKADLAANRITRNMHYGLLVISSADVSARRNFWGDGHGPAGAFAGAGNAVLGLNLEEVAPWLPAEPEELVLRSVSALVIDSPRGQRIEFDASDRLGLIIELYQVGRGEPGRTELISQGLVIAARYASRPEDIPPLGLEMAFYAITVEGLDVGTAELTVFYREEDQPPGLDPEKLQLFALEDGEWKPLPGKADPKLQRVTGEMDVQQLDGRLIGLGMQAPQPQLQSNLLPVPGSGKSQGAKANTDVNIGGAGSEEPGRPAFILLVLLLIPIAWLFWFLSSLIRSRLWARGLRIRVNRP